MTAQKWKTGNQGLHTVPVSAEDASMIKRVHRILRSGDDVEIRIGRNGSPKVLRVSKEEEKE